jgi:peptidoglycan/xylan/chitin deacetylase (PgdA/CDA1 family)
MLKKIFFTLAKYSGLNFLYGYFSGEKVFIVGYHSVFSEVDGNAVKTSEYGRVSLPVDLFEKQIRFMVKNGHSFVLFKDLPNLKKSKIKKPTIVYFDDGFKDNILNVLPILKKYGIPAAFFVVPKYLDSGNPVYMDWNDVRKLRLEGMEIGSHTSSHRKLTEAPEKVLWEELVRSKEKIEKEINFPAEVFSYPKGRLNGEVVAAVKNAGYKYAVTTKYGVNSYDYVSENPYLLKKVAPRVYESFSDFKVRLYSYNIFR